MYRVRRVGTDEPIFVTKHETQIEIERKGKCKGKVTKIKFYLCLFQVRMG